MALSKVDVTLKTGGVGVVPANNQGLFAVIGLAWAGTVNAVSRIRSVADLITSHVGGDLVDGVSDAFIAGARDVYACKAQGDVAGTIGSVTESKTGDGTVTPSGAPTDAWDFTVKILTGGGLGTATARITASVNGKARSTSNITVPAGGTHVVTNTGITLTFAATTGFALDDQYDFSTTAPSSSVSAIDAAVDAIVAQAAKPEWILVTGPTDEVLWAGLKAKAEALQALGIFLFFVAETESYTLNAGVPDVAAWITALTTARAGADTYLVAAVAGRVNLTDREHGELERNGAGLMCGHLAAADKVSRSPGRVRSGAVGGALSVAPATITEAQIDSIDDLGFVGFRPYIGKAGVFVTRGHMLSTTDLGKVERMRVLLKAARAVYALAVDELQDDFQVDADESGLRAIEERLVRPIRLMQGAGECSGGSVRVLTTVEDLLITEALAVLVEIVPNGLVASMGITLGLSNPFLTN